MVLVLVSPVFQQTLLPDFLKWGVQQQLSGQSGGVVAIVKDLWRC